MNLRPLMRAVTARDKRKRPEAASLRGVFRVVFKTVKPFRLVSVTLVIGWITLLGRIRSLGLGRIGRRGIAVLAIIVIGLLIALLGRGLVGITALVVIPALGVVTAGPVRCGGRATSRADQSACKCTDSCSASATRKGADRSPGATANQGTRTSARAWIIGAAAGTEQGTKTRHTQNGQWPFAA